MLRSPLGGVGNRINFAVASVIRLRATSWALSASSSALLVVNSRYQDLLGFGTLPSVKGDHFADTDWSSLSLLIDAPVGRV